MELKDCIKIQEKICERYYDDCDSCILSDISEKGAHNDGTCLYYENLISNYESKLEQWAKDNPVKTYKYKLYESLPDAFYVVKNFIMNDYTPEKIFGIAHNGKKWTDEYMEETK